MKIIDYLRSFWEGLSESEKERIIKIIVDAFETAFRSYYANYQG